MKSDPMTVVAVIPNYNMGRQLKTLIPQVLAQGYDSVYVLDDASTDNSVSIVKSFGNAVKLIEGTKNIGGGGNRNRILTELVSPTLIHFIDADVTFVTLDTADIIRRISVNSDMGFVGGLVLDESGKQSIWNYGPRQTILSAVGATVLWMSENTPFYNLLKNFYSKRPVAVHTLVTQNVYWVLECNFIIRSDTLQKLGGFDESIREHDIQPLAYEAERQGLYNLFDPSFAVMQYTVNVRTYNRNSSKHKAELYLAKKYGLWRWLLSLPSKKTYKKDL
jgi:N-acetylglucosaminyl-diphospho-decaprenol L-rhamnosyltransferase